MYVYMHRSSCIKPCIIRFRFDAFCKTTQNFQRKICLLDSSNFRCAYRSGRTGYADALDDSCLGSKPHCKSASTHLESNPDPVRVYEKLKYFNMK